MTDLNFTDFLEWNGLIEFKTKKIPSNNTINVDIGIHSKSFESPIGIFRVQLLNSWFTIEKLESSSLLSNDDGIGILEFTFFKRMRGWGILICLKVPPGTGDWYLAILKIVISVQAHNYNFSRFNKISAHQHAIDK